MANPRAVIRIIKLSIPLVISFLISFAFQNAVAQDSEIRVLRMNRNDSKLLKTNPLIVIDQKKLKEIISTLDLSVLMRWNCPTIGITPQQLPRDWRSLEDMIRDAGNRP
jgi:hypothetical protein